MMDGVAAQTRVDEGKILTLGLWMGALGVPLLFSGPQLVVGSIVNTLLFVVSKRLSRRELIMMAILPSLAAVGHGVLFGGLTGYLIKLLPFIWVGNFLLMVIYRRISNKWGGVAIASALKAGWLWGAASLLSTMGVVPQIMVPLMGATQLATALIGGVGANLVMKRK